MIIKGSTYSQVGTGIYEANTADQRIFWQNSLFFKFAGRAGGLDEWCQKPSLIAPGVV